MGMIATIGMLAEVAAGARREGRRVGVVNGCFDVIHPGHLALFRACRSAAGLVLALVNSDASVVSLKGANRPLQPLRWRMEVVAALGDVDFVAPFGGEQALNAAMLAIQPDVLVKGSEYRGTEIPGADIVESRRGEVIFLHQDGQSTTAFVDEVVRRFCGGGASG